MIQNKFVNTLIIERIKREIPSSMGQKLHSYQENRMQWLYYGALIYQEQNELRRLGLKAWQGYYSLYDMASSEKHHKALRRGIIMIELYGPKNIEIFCL